MYLTVFRSRLRPESQAEYVEVSARMSERVASMPGYLRHKTFTAEDGERVTICEFDSAEALGAWSADPDHEAAKTRGVEALYSEYRIQVCEVTRTRDLDQLGRPQGHSG